MRLLGGATTYHLTRVHSATADIGETVSFSRRIRPYASVQGRFLYLSESGRTRTLPYFFWILTPEAVWTVACAPIVIDTGFREEYGPRVLFSRARRRAIDYADYRQQRELLGHFGIKPSEVETLIVSHLHWDKGRKRFMSPRLFTTARFYLQKRRA